MIFSFKKCWPWHLISLGSAIKEEDEAVSPPPQAEMVPLVNEQKPPPTITESSLNLSTNVTPPSSRSRSPPTTTASRIISETQRILPPSEPRKTGTCYFCKKSFMKNKQLMNHVCPKKPRSSGGSNGGAGAGATMSSKSPTWKWNIVFRKLYSSQYKIRK